MKTKGLIKRARSVAKPFRITDGESKLKLTSGPVLVALLLVFGQVHAQTEPLPS